MPRHASTATIPPFRGWPPEALAFYAGLAEDNSKAYFDAHRQTYEQAVRLPMESLLEEVADEFGEGRVFRPNRDTRFAKDKSPYKLNIAAYTAGGYYVALSADDGLIAAAGRHELSRDELAAYRRAVLDDEAGPELERIAAELQAAGLTFAGSELKRAPRGFDPEHPRVALLRHRRVYAWRSWPPRRWLHTRAAHDRVVETWRAARPLREWLARHVG